MGIKELSKLIKKETDAYVERKFSDFFAYTILVDISIFLYKSIKMHGELIDAQGNSSGAWVHWMIRFFITLKASGMKLVIVFDGPNAPIEKLKARAQRIASSAHVAEKLDTAERLLGELEAINDRYEPDDLTVHEVPLDLRTEVRELCKKQKNKSKFEELDYRTLGECLRVLRKTKDKFEKQCIKITTRHADIVKEIAVALGLSVLQADGEAETLCAYMCKNNVGFGGGTRYAVLSEDTDVLVYGTPLFLSKIDLKAGTVKSIRFENLLSKLDMSHESFMDLCIMCGCDYNHRISIPSKTGKKPTGVGHVKALKLIREHGTLENVEYMTELDLEPLCYQRCRKLFTLPGKPGGLIDLGDMYGELVIPHAKPIDEKLLNEVFIKHKCKFLLPSLRKAWRPTEVEFEDDDVVSSSKELELSPEEDIKTYVDLSDRDVQDQPIGSCDDTWDEPTDTSDRSCERVRDDDLPVTDRYVIYSDGSCRPNPGPGGWAALITTPGSKCEKTLLGGDDTTTNNRMELLAVISSLEYLDETLHVRPKCAMTVYTDSKYIADNVHNVPKWRSKGWKSSFGKKTFAIKNVDLWTRLDAMCRKFTVTFSWVKAHNGDPNNERVDALAGAETEKRKKGNRG